MSILEKHQQLIAIRQEQAQIKRDTEAQLILLGKKAYNLKREIELTSSLIDVAQVDLARTVLSIRGTFSRAGDERQSVIDDAIYQLATGEPMRGKDLNETNFGTKSYAQWHGQRCDCQPFCGPRHGSIIFSVGLTEEARKSGGIGALTDEQREAAIYLLNGLESIQAAEAKAAA